MSKTFKRYTLQDFIHYILKPMVGKVRFPELHIHGTWKPTKADYRKRPGEHYMQAMYRAHRARGFTDIAQHATIDPDGFIWDGRPLVMPPASATGENDSDADGAHPFMFEMIGNFDAGQERLEGAQLASSVGLSKAVIELFEAVPHFHREYTDKKTCPGSGISKEWLLNQIKEAQPMKYKPTIIKERIRKLPNGNLVFIPINTDAEKKIAYSNPGTDVRLLKLDRNKVRFEFVAEKGAKVSALVKKHRADLGFNFPFFDRAAQLPIGYVWANGGYINGAWGQMKEWYELGINGGSATIGRFTNVQRQQFDFSVQGKILIANGLMAWKDDGEQCQRTFAWTDELGNLYVAFADGRTGSDDGLTCEEMALYAKKKGAKWAIEGDGGGSTILADQLGGLNQALNTGANERVVHHAVLVYCLEEKPVTQAYKDSDPITYGDLKKLGLVS